MAKYELVLVMPGNFEKEQLQSLSQKIKTIITNVKGSIKQEDDWEVKKLAYPINKNKLGHYFIWQIELPGDQINETRRLFNFETNLLRYLLLKVHPVK